MLPWMLLALASFEVHGLSDCPRPEAVEERLASVPAKGDHLVELAHEEGHLRVRLLDARGALLGERDLGSGASCDELAEAAAVLISAWTIDFPALELPELQPQATAPGDAPKLTPDAPPPAPPPAPLVADLEPISIARETPVALPVARAFHERSGSHDLTLGFSHGIGSRLTSSDGFMLSYLFWILDGVGIEGSFNWHPFTGTNSFGQEIEFNFPGDNPPIDDYYAPRIAAGVSSALSLARGPAELIGLLPGPSFELYGVFGFGGGSIHRSANQNGGFFSVPDNQSSFIFQGGMGLRFFAFREALGFDLEIRDLFFPDPSGGTTHSIQLQGALRISVDPSAYVARDEEASPRRSLANRLQLTAQGGVSLIDRFVTTRAVSFGISYDFFDFFAIEAIGAYMFSGSSALTKEVLDEGKLTPELAKIVELRGALAGGVRLNALRGRFAPLGIPIEGDLTVYFSGGAGVGWTRVICTPGMELDPEVHGFGALCDQPSSDINIEELILVYEPTRRVPLGYFAGGVDLHFFEMLGLSVELRDYIFNAHVVRPQTTEPSQRDSQDTRHIVMAQLGVSIILF